jgi:hypothetical protein
MSNRRRKSNRETVSAQFARSVNGFNRCFWPVCAATRSRGTKANNVERVLADIDANHGHGGVE